MNPLGPFFSFANCFSLLKPPEMTRFLLLLAAGLLALQPLAAQVRAFLDVDLGNGSMATIEAGLDWQVRPITVANFLMLADAKEDIWVGNTPNPNSPIGGYLFQPAGLPPISNPPPVIERNERPNLLVRAVPSDPQELEIVIFQSAIQFPTPTGTVRLRRTRDGFEEDVDDPVFFLEQEFVGGQRWVLRLKPVRRWWRNINATDQDGPYYNNLPFTNIVRGRRITGGSPSAFAGDGPGYVIQDEVIQPNGGNDPFGNPFSQPYILAMDNGGPNTAGSRFFITSDREQEGDEWTGRYTPFGIVVPGSRITVDNLTQLEERDQPGTVRQGVKLIRVRYSQRGQSAFYFPHFDYRRVIPKPPVNSNFGISKIEFDRSKEELKLTTLLAPRQQALFLAGSDLPIPNRGLIFGAGNTINVPANVQGSPIATESVFPLQPGSILRQFYRDFLVNHPRWPSSAELPDLKGKRLSFAETNPPAGEVPRRFQLRFDDGGNATEFVINGQTTPFAIDGYDPSQGPFLGVLTFSMPSTDLPLQRIHLFFDATFSSTESIRRFQAFEPEQEVVTPNIPPEFNLPTLLYQPSFTGVWTIE